MRISILILTLLLGMVSIYEVEKYAVSADVVIEDLEVSLATQFTF